MATTWTPKNGQATPNNGEYILWKNGRTYQFHKDHGFIDYGPITPEHREYCRRECRREGR